VAGLQSTRKKIMPLNVRSIAVSVGVICFFAVAGIGWFSGLSPFTCCKRALVGAAAAYIAGAWAVKAINAILMNAMITSRMEQQKEEDDAG
jgi:hypothetical protein